MNNFQHFNSREHIAHLLAEAQEQVLTVGNLESAAARVADAGLLLRQLVSQDNQMPQEVNRD